MSQQPVDPNSPESESNSQIDIPECTNEYKKALIDHHNIKVFDSNTDSGLELFCSIKNEDDPDPLLKECRGLVFKGDELILKGFPYTQECTVDDDLPEILKDLEFWKFYDAEEGCLVRVFHIDGKWWISTHRKLDAFRSKWSSDETFGRMFKNAVIEMSKEGGPLETSAEDPYVHFLDNLNKDHQYMFLVRNNQDNRIVCEAPETPFMYHVGAYIWKDTTKTERILSLDVQCKVPYPRQHRFTTVEKLVKVVEDRSPGDIQGIICFSNHNTEVVKITNTEYKKYFEVRGNEPSIQFRYLQVRTDLEKRDMLYFLYPSMSKIFDKYEDMLYTIAGEIEQAYVNRFINRQYITLPQPEFTVMKLAHDWHQQSKAKHKIRKTKIIEIMNLQSPSDLNRMIRKRKLEEYKRLNGIPDSPKEDSDRPPKEGKVPNTPPDGDLTKQSTVETQKQTLAT